MKKNLMLGFALVSVFALMSCESDLYRRNYDAEMRELQMYKQAYMELQQLKQNGMTQQTVTNTPVTTVTTVNPATTAQATADRTEKLTIVGTGVIMTYNVVCGSFTKHENALNLQATLKNKGYNCILATNERGMYRVIAATFNDRASAVTSRDQLRLTYPDAWLLINQK